MELSFIGMTEKLLFFLVKHDRCSSFFLDFEFLLAYRFNLALLVVFN